MNFPIRCIQLEGVPMFYVRKMIFLFLPLFLFIPLLLMVVVSPAVLGTFTQALVQSQQGGLGGAFGATSYTPASSANAPVTRLSDPGQAKIYGGSGPGGVCLGTSGAGNDMIHMDFGWAASYLNKNWQNYDAYRLCNDHYTWETVTNIPLQKVLQTLQWPPDLLDPQYTNQMVTLEPLNSFDPVTQQAQQQQQQVTQQNQSSGPCDWVPDLVIAHPHIDICAPIRLLVGAGSAAIRGVYQNTTAQINFMWQTPLAPFQVDASGGLLTIWSTSWAIVLACITVVVAYGGLRYMLGSAVNWLAYATISELIPRLLFGLLAAYFSKEFFIMLIQANNALAGIFNQNTLDVVIYGKTTGVVSGCLQIVYGLMGFLLIIEEAARLAILYLLFAFAPILFFLASLRETQRWAKTAATAAIIFVFMQAIQAATLDVGGRVLSTVLHNTDGNLSFLNILVSLAILYITLALFFILARMALGHGASPLGIGVLRGYAAPRIAAGYAGNALHRYREMRNNAFPLPDRSGRAPWATSAPQPASTMRGSPGNSGGQTAVSIKGQPPMAGGSPGSGTSGSNGNKPGGAPSPGGSNGNKPGGAPGSSGSSNNNRNSPGSSRTPLNTSGQTNNSPAGNGSPSAGGRSAGASSVKQPVQWQKAPPNRVARPPIDPMKP